MLCADRTNWFQAHQFMFIVFLCRPTLKLIPLRGLHLGKEYETEAQGSSLAASIIKGLPAAQADRMQGLFARTTIF